MTEYKVGGMTCAACAARVEKAAKSISGTESVSVNLLTGRLVFVGGDPTAVAAAVRAQGYTCDPPASHDEATPYNAAHALTQRKNSDSRMLLIRLSISLFFLLPLLYLSMGVTMWHFPLPPILQNQAPAIALLELLLSLAILLCNQSFFIRGIRGLLRLAPNMDTLVSLGSGVSFLYSIGALFAMLLGNSAITLHDLYFESAAMILVLISVGKLLEARAKGKARDAVESLLCLSPKHAILLRDGSEVTVPVSEVRVGDLFLVRPGSEIPVDGIVIEGESAVNESTLTGESLPIEKRKGAPVYAATANENGALTCRATAVGDKTAFQAIVKMVESATATKAPIARLADRVSAVFVPIVLLIAAVTFSVWMLCGAALGFALSRAITVLVISCPCALGLATPVAVTVAGGVGAKSGILYKNAEAMELAGSVKAVALDKTGTLTEGKPVLIDIRPAEGVTEETLLTLAAALEAKSEHPLARAVTAAAKDRAISLPPVEGFVSHAGAGVEATCKGSRLYGGSLRMIGKLAPLPPNAMQDIERLSAEGKTPLLFVKDGAYIGLLAVADRLRTDSIAAVRALRKAGLRVVLLTGDNERTAKAIASEAGITEIRAACTPADKAAAISELQRNGPVMMIGDGVNDAPALAAADIGVAIGSGTDVAQSTADIVLPNSKLSDAVAAIHLSKSTLRTVKENLAFAFLYNIIGIPLAAGVFYSAFGLLLPPMFGAAAMSLSSFCVVTNALRLSFFRKHKAKSPPDHLQRKDPPPMKKEMKIEGMMCPHCSRRVKEALEAIPAVSEAAVSHESGSAVLLLKEAVDESTLLAAVTDAGYRVHSIS